jgi:hypothetical protein
MIYSKQVPEFITVTCLNWTAVLKEDRFKDVIIESSNSLQSLPFRGLSFSAESSVSGTLAVK